MIILVGMSSMKSSYKKNRSKQKETGSYTESFLFCPILSEGLDVPTIYIGPERAEFSKHLDATSSL